MTDLAQLSEDDARRMRKLMEFGKLDLIRTCPRCGMRSIGETERACSQCLAFAERRRDVTEADWHQAMADGLIGLPSKQKP